MRHCYSFKNQTKTIYTFLTHNVWHYCGRNLAKSLQVLKSLAYTKVFQLLHIWQYSQLIKCEEKLNLQKLQGTTNVSRLPPLTVKVKYSISLIM